MKRYIPLTLLCLFNFSIVHARALDLDLTSEDVISNNQETETEIASNCLNDYRKWRNKTAITSGLTPFVGIAGTAGSGMLALGWEYGGWYALKEALGPIGTTIAGSAINFVIPTTVVLGTLTFETVMISKFIKASKSYRLVKGLYTQDKNKPFEQLVKRIQKKRPELSAEIIKQELIKADSNGSLCNGSMVHRKTILSSKLAKRLATLKDMEKSLLKIQ